MTAKARDMSERQLREALKRNGFKHEFMGYFRDTTGQAPDWSWPGVFQLGPRGAVKMLRRETLARLIQCRVSAVKESRKVSKP